MRITAVWKPDRKRWRLFFLCFLSVSLILSIFTVSTIGNMETVTYTLAENADILQGEKVAYLTFDDGPSTVTDELLDTLKQKKVKATFFVVGTGGTLDDTERKRLWKRIVDEGHLIGLHTWSHDNYHDIYRSADDYIQSIIKLQQAVFEVTGVKSICFRFPGGSNNSYCNYKTYSEIVSSAEKLGLSFYDWNVDGQDAIGVNTTANSVAKAVVRDAKKLETPVILLHDIPSCKGSVQAIARIVDELTAAGYHFDTVDHLKKEIHQSVRKK